MQQVHVCKIRAFDLETMIEERQVDLRRPEFQAKSCSILEDTSRWVLV